MVTYILFVFGTFEDHQDVEFFCLEIFNNSDLISSVKYVIENQKNIIIIFESDKDIQSLKKEIGELLNNDNITFYFLFERDDIVLSHLPKVLRDYAFKPVDENTLIKIEKSVKKSDFNLDDILDKIDKYGFESLTFEEKKYLDDFAK